MAVEANLKDVHDIVHLRGADPGHITTDEILILMGFMADLPHMANMGWSCQKEADLIVDLHPGDESMLVIDFAAYEDQPAQQVIYQGVWPLPIVAFCSKVCHLLMRQGMAQFPHAHTPEEAFMRCVDDYGPFSVPTRDELAGSQVQTDIMPDDLLRKASSRHSTTAPSPFQKADKPTYPC